MKSTRTEVPEEDVPEEYLETPADRGKDLRCDMRLSAPKPSEAVVSRKRKQQATSSKSGAQKTSHIFQPKALQVQKAFQQVLDDPAAMKALTQTPALKPLLDLAAK